MINILFNIKLIKMLLFYEIYLNEDKVYKCDTREEAHAYIS